VKALLDDIDADGVAQQLEQIVFFAAHRLRLGSGGLDDDRDFAGPLVGPQSLERGEKGADCRQVPLIGCEELVRRCLRSGFEFDGDFGVGELEQSAIGGRLALETDDHLVFGLVHEIDPGDPAAEFLPDLVDLVADAILCLDRLHGLAEADAAIGGESFRILADRGFTGAPCLLLFTGIRFVFRFHRLLRPVLTESRYRKNRSCK
jgi:hypothetical protein